VAAAKPERPVPRTPTPKPEPSVVKSPPRSRSRTCRRRRRAALPLHQVEPRFCIPCSASASLPPLVTTSSPPCQEREVRNPLDLVVDPAFEPRLDRALCVARCPASRRRADPPSLESRPSSRAGRLQVPLHTATRALLALHRVDLVPTSARRVPARRRYPHAEHTTVERRPYLYLAWSRVSTNPCRAHVVGVVPSPWLCRRPFTRTH
jgi:hypothetical protein